MSTVVNAIIESVQFGRKEHGILSMWLILDYGDGAHQGFGGFNLYNKNVTHAACGKFIWRCMDVAGVDEFQDIVGKPIRVRLSDEGWNAGIEAIGHIIKDDWFEPKELRNENMSQLQGAAC